jgi:hypothetical protein
MPSWYERALAALLSRPPATQQPVHGIQVHHPYVAPTMPNQPPQQYAPTQQQNLPGGTNEERFRAYLAQGTPDTSKVHQESGSCPNCFGPNLITIPGQSVMTAGGTRIPVERCTDCNYPANQEFSTYGAGTLATPNGDVHRARQLPADYRPAGAPTDMGHM